MVEPSLINEFFDIDQLIEEASIDSYGVPCSKEMAKFVRFNPFERTGKIQRKDVLNDLKKIKLDS